MALIAIIQSIVGRLFLLTHSTAVIGFSTILMKNNLYGMLGALALFQIAEGLYMVVVRKGYEYKWLSVSTFCYLLTVVPPLWFVENKILQDYRKSGGNVTTGDVTFEGFSFDQKLGLEILKQTLLLVIMVHRWVIPRGALTRNALSQLLFVFFAMASDIMELFELFDEPRVMANGVVGYAILGVWSFSLLQMCMVLTNTRSVNRSRAVHLEEDEEFDRQVGEDPPGPDCCYSAMATDLWSVMLTLVCMDVPFLAVRMYIVVKLNVITYGILFFTVKNMLVIILSIYRFVIICGGNLDDDEDEGQQKMPEHMLKNKSNTNGSMRHRNNASVKSRSNGNKVVPAT